jgi:hypothetical protein
MEQVANTLTNVILALIVSIACLLIVAILAWAAILKLEHRVKLLENQLDGLKVLDAQSKTNRLRMDWLGSGRGGFRR